MWIAENWEDYEVLDSSCGEKLERWGKYCLLRPDPQVLWNTPRRADEWERPNAHYHRSKSGGGEWEFFNLPETWNIKYDLVLDDNASTELIFNLKPFSFKHTGVFPEQACNWDWFSKLIYNESSKGKDIRVLNLFAYTGGATMAAAKAGAHVTHVDASKGIIQWAKENAHISGIDETKLRWLVDDCRKFIEREIRRGNKYDAVIMDPPSYGRGPKGEIWKMEDSIFEFIRLSSEVLKDDALFFLINSYTTGLQPAVLTYMLSEVLPQKFGGRVESDEIGLPVRSNGLVLPCGASGRWFRGNAS